MGIGRFDEATHKFNLVLSINYAASAADMDQLKKSFQRASELLYDATDGKHQFGEATVCVNSLGGNNADIWIIESPNPANPTVDSGGYNAGIFATQTSGAHMTLDKLVMNYPLLIVHEFGHYVYGLLDEYRFPDGTTGAHCVNPTTTNPNPDACIMEASQVDGDHYNAGTLIQGRISEFCILSNHTTTNAQGSTPCWQTMANNYRDLDPPPSSTVQTPPTMPAAASINWVVVDTSQRFVLVIDRSGSMTGQKLAEAKLGADWWADALPLNDYLGIVSFSNTAVIDYPMQAITGQTDRDNAKAKIQLITAGGTTSIGEGLLKARDEILKPGLPPAAAKVIVLLTDGRQNTGKTPYTTLPSGLTLLEDLQQNQIKVYTIGIGADVDPILLQDIATQTGGQYYVA